MTDVAPATGSNGFVTFDMRGVKTQSLTVGLPPQILEKIKGDAKANGRTMNAEVRAFLADHYHMTLLNDVSKPQSRYATKEERQAAERSRQNARRDLVANIVAKATSAELTDEQRAVLSAMGITPEVLAAVRGG